MSHIYVWHDSCICKPWIIRMCHILDESYMCIYMYMCTRVFTPARCWLVCTLGRRESCHTYGWGTSRHVTPRHTFMTESCHTFMNESCHNVMRHRYVYTYARVHIYVYTARYRLARTLDVHESHMDESHCTFMNESCHNVMRQIYVYICKCVHIDSYTCEIPTC